MQSLPHLQVHARDVVADGDSSGAVDNLYSDGSLALGLQHVADQVLGRKIDVAAPVRVVLTQYALRIQATQAPATRQSPCKICTCSSQCVQKSSLRLLKGFQHRPPPHPGSQHHSVNHKLGIAQGARPSDAGFDAVSLQNFSGRLCVERSQAIMPENKLEVSVLNSGRPIFWRRQCLDRLYCRLLYKCLRQSRVAFPRKWSGELDQPRPHVFLCRDDSRRGTSANCHVRQQRQQAPRWSAAHA